MTNEEKILACLPLQEQAAWMATMARQRAIYEAFARDRDSVTREERDQFAAGNKRLERLATAASLIAIERGDTALATTVLAMLLELRAAHE